MTRCPVSHRYLVSLALVIGTVLAACSPSAPPGQAASGPTGAADANGIRRTSWGEPNIEGTYTNKDEFGTPFERPDELAGKPRSEFGPEQMAELMKFWMKVMNRSPPAPRTCSCLT